VLSREISSNPISASAMNRRTAMTLSWFGQTVASACWIASVFASGVSSIGDALQLAAATAWMTANPAALRESTA